MFPSRGRGTLCDFPATFWGKSFCSGSTALPAAQLPQGNGGRIFTRIGYAAVLDDLTRGKIHDKLCELVRVRRTPA
jgi:hypothetical protein